MSFVSWAKQKDGEVLCVTLVGNKSAAEECSVTLLVIMSTSRSAFLAHFCQKLGSLMSMSVRLSDTLKLAWKKKVTHLMRKKVQWEDYRCVHHLRHNECRAAPKLHTECPSVGPGTAPSLSLPPLSHAASYLQSQRAFQEGGQLVFLLFFPQVLFHIKVTPTCCRHAKYPIMNRCSIYNNE